MENDILLIDGNSMLFRAYYATLYSGGRLSSSNGVATNAVYTFITMINKAIAQINPSYIMVAWDAGKPTFRHAMFDEYKGTRKELDPELKVQFPIAREYLDARGIYRYEEEGIEADDIIGTLSKRFKNYYCHILSSDNDLLQLIDDSTEVLLMKKGISDMQKMDVTKLKEVKGVTPKQIIELKGLMGDSSDNIPGVKGIGEKTAVKLLESYGSVAGVYEHIDEIKGKLQEKLINDKDKAFLSLKLATIKTDCEIPCELNDFVYHEADAKTNAFFAKYNMNSLITNNTDKDNATLKPLEIHKVKQFDLNLLNSDLGIILDYDCELYYESELYGIALVSDNKIYYEDKETMLADPNLNRILNADNFHYSYDVKMVYHLLDRYGFNFRPFDADIKIAAFLSDNQTNTFEKLAFKYGYNLKYAKSNIYGKPGRPQLPLESDRMVYLSEQATILKNVIEILKSELDSNEMNDLFKSIEMPISYILFKMEKEGITTSKEVLMDIENKTNDLLKQLEQQIFKYVGHEFNVNSPKQLGEVLFDELGLNGGKKRSTAIDVLEKLSYAHPMIPLLIEYRKYQKINSTYAIGLQKHIRGDGKIHTLFHQCLTQTGRLSSSDPNLQNLSVKDEEAREIRKAFVAQPGHLLYACDYSQIELRVLAHMANESNMINAFNQNIDIHTRTAMGIFHCDKDEVTPLMRRQAKTVNFGMVYGQTQFGLAKELGIAQNEAKKFMDKYFESYPQIHEFMDKTVAFCQDNGYVKTLFNRRRYIEEINAKDYMTREFGKRAAMNAPIQGSAADIIKIAMIKVDEAMQKQKVKSKMILQIHDELVFDIEPEEKQLMEGIVQKAMSNAMRLAVPLKAEGKFATDYYECK